ncbi:MAG TPA: hypothetical protein VIQ54_16125 [Polyangia bacterium]
MAEALKQRQPFVAVGARARGAQRGDALVGHLRLRLQLHHQRELLRPHLLAPPVQRPCRRLLRLRQLPALARDRPIVLGRAEPGVAAHALAVAAVRDTVGLELRQVRQ